MELKQYALEVRRTLPALHEIYCSDSSGNDDFVPIRTINYIPAPGIIKTTSDHIIDTIHMRLGMFSEISELMEAIAKNDPVNIGEELGDVLWYACNDLHIKNLRSHITDAQMNFLLELHFGSEVYELETPKLFIAEGPAQAINALIYSTSCLADFAKKDLAYGKPEDLNSYIDNIKNIFKAVNNIAIYSRINMFEYMQKNIDKLKSRFPDKFDADKANNRDLKKERKKLEGN